MKLILFHLFILIFYIQDCQAQSKSDKTEINRLNKKAIELARNGSQDSILKAISIIDQAIQTDSSYANTYTNKATLFCRLDNYKEAIKNLDRAIFLKPNLIEVKVLKGFMLEKTGDFTNSRKIYLEAIMAYDSKIKSDTNNVALKINRALLFFFTETRNKALNEFNKIKKTYPTNQMVLDMESYFDLFNKEIFLNLMCSN